MLGHHLRHLGFDFERLGVPVPDFMRILAEFLVLRQRQGRTRCWREQGGRTSACIPGLSSWGGTQHQHVVGHDLSGEGDQERHWVQRWVDILGSRWAIWQDQGQGVGVIVPMETAAEVIAGAHCPQHGESNVAEGHMFPMRGYAVPAIAQLNRVSYQIGFILSTYQLPADQAVGRYVEETAEADLRWKRFNKRLGGPKDMLACAQAGGSWGNNFSWRNRKYAQ